MKIQKNNSKKTKYVDRCRARYEMRKPYSPNKERVQPLIVTKLKIKQPQLKELVKEPVNELVKEPIKEPIKEKESKPRKVKISEFKVLVPEDAKPLPEKTSIKQKIQNAFSVFSKVQSKQTISSKSKLTFWGSKKVMSQMSDPCHQKQYQQQQQKQEFKPKTQYSAYGLNNQDNQQEPSLILEPYYLGRSMQVEGGYPIQNLLPFNHTKKNSKKKEEIGSLIKNQELPSNQCSNSKYERNFNPKNIGYEDDQIKQKQNHEIETLNIKITSKNEERRHKSEEVTLQTSFCNPKDKKYGKSGFQPCMGILASSPTTQVIDL